MFSWLKRKVVDSEDITVEHEDAPPSKIRTPKHAARDARMSIPAGEREYYEVLEARKRAGGPSSSLGTSVMKGKGKGRSPLAYDSGLPSFEASPAFSKASSHISSHGYDARLGKASSHISSNGTDTDSQQTASRMSSSAYDAEVDGSWRSERSSGVRRDSTAHTSLAESSSDAAAKAKAKQQSGKTNGTAG